MTLFKNGYLLTTFVLVLVNNKYVNADQIGTSGPTVVTEGKDALLTCVIMVPFGNDTVIWRRGHNEILAAGKNRVTSDKRISVLHDDAPKGKVSSGGDVWVLLIKNAQPSDTDLYVCEVNSDPPITSFHPLKIKALNSTKKTTTDAVQTTSAPDEDVEIYEPDPYIHDFTKCCEAANVTTQCLGFCTIHNIMDGTTGVEPDICEDDFPRIVKCMADGRNHLPCCEEKKIPDLCQDMCRGEYTPFTDLVKSRVSCVAYTLPALRCILEGVQNIPSPPTAISVESLNENSLEVSWSPPANLADRVNSYSINVTTLHSFDEDILANTTSEITVTVSGDLSSTVIHNLKPFTMYSVTMTANNNFGSSLPSDRIRAITLDGTTGIRKSVAVVPVLPDIRSCCIKNGMTHHSCIDKMCDPKKADFTKIPDLMVCAPWANITFSCLANKIDHTPCCTARGIPDSCLSFCSGNVATVTYSLFKCMQYMSEYSSCLLQGYGVLAGSPLRVKAPLTAQQFAIVEWMPPKVLPETVEGYSVHIRKLNSDDDYETYEKDQSPFIIENLEPGTYYEVFVAAINAHGKGAPSTRLIFETKHLADDEDSSIRQSYNITACCKAANVMPQCMPLCSYDLKMTDLHLLGQTCALQMGALAKCAAGGRDHRNCCVRRGVIPKCLSLCHGVIPSPPVDCLAYGGNIIQCFEEGTDKIPGPVENLQADYVNTTSVSLKWNPNVEDATNSSSKSPKVNNIDFVVQYGKVNNMTLYETVVKMPTELATKDNDIVLSNLEPNSLYRILVHARGEHGMSLPSSMLIINTTEIPDNVNNNNKSVYGVPSPPHSLSISTHTPTYVTIAWNPPEFSHPHERITYRVFHKATADNETFSIIETRLLWARINNLTPNSQHVMYVVAINDKGQSLPSETLVAWTDPALPAFVDPPTIHPDMVPEGGSMTILCTALGSPTPTISLYVGGHLVRVETTRTMVTIIQNVSRDMDIVTCLATNGYGSSVQPGKKVYISYAPQIQASGITLALLNDRVELKCVVKAKPPPKVVFWRDHEGRNPIPLGSNYEMSTQTSSEDTTLTTMTLTIVRLTNEFVGDYFCHAENVVGQNTRAVSVRIRNTPAAHNISECCVAQNVSSYCMDACSFYIDIDAVKDRPECLGDFHKLMKCAADGSDHRSCCANAAVPRYCLNWCRGEPLTSGKGPACVLEHTKTIVDCFQSNRDRLPSPPTNLEILVVSDSEALVKWEPPIKNPHMVEGYRVYWHEVESTTENNPINSINGFGTYRVDTKDLNIRIADLRPNIIYELVVKAGNQYGSSILTEPKKFQLGNQHIISASQSGAAGTLLSIFACIIIIGLGVAAVLLYKQKLMSKSIPNEGVSFENPSYMREVNMDNTQISTVSPDTAISWRPEAAHMSQTDLQNIPTATEINPTLYDELKLGHKGAGFKRLVS